MANSDRLIRLLLFSFLGLLLSVNSFGHEIRPAYLEIREVESNQFEVLWKIPTMSGRGPKIIPSISGFSFSLLRNESSESAYVQTFKLEGESSLRGQRIRIEGLEKTLIDVLLRIEWLDDPASSFMLQPDRTELLIPDESSESWISITYLVLGVEHILLGYDHLLFVLALILLLPGWNVLIKTITAFTIAHSITLAISALGWFSLPQAPVEAVIALSIVFLAREYVLLQRGIKSISAEKPWLVAFVFGLLHGLGFAGALREIGLPEGAILPALLSFNIGVELGQLLFVALVFLLVFVIVKILRSNSEFLRKQVPLITAYGIGGVGVYWLIERINSFF